MTLRSLRRFLLAFMAVVLLVVIVPTVAGAAVTTAAPWTTTPATNWGECNEVVLSAFPGGGTGSAGGWWVQLACQGEIPTGSVIQDVSPTLPLTSSYVIGSGGSTVNTTNYASLASSAGGASWEALFPNTSQNRGATPASGSASCAATVGNSPSDDVWYTVSTAGSNGPNEGLACSVPAYQPTGTPSLVPLSGSATNPWYQWAQVQALSVGASSTASNGHAMQAFALYESVEVNNVVNCATTCGSHTGSPDTPDTPILTSGTTCGSSLVSTASQYTFNGVNLNWNSEPDTPVLNMVSLASGTSSWYSGSAPYGISLQLDSVTCLPGPPSQGQSDATMPSTYYTGGSATGGLPNQCGLVSVQGYNLDDGSPPTLQSNRGYSITVVYTGDVGEIALDPNDGSTANVQFGPPTVSGVYAAVELGSDATVVPASGSPQTIDYTVATTGAWNPELWCLANGTVYNWGFLSGLGNAGPGSTIGSSGGQSCTTNSSFQTTCAQSSSLAACFASAGWSLTNPVSWVTGALHDGVCILEWLFVPSTSSLTGFTGLFAVNSTGTGAATGVGPWIGSLTSFATGFPATAVSQIQSAADSGTCNVGPTVPLDGHNFTVCSAVSSAGGSTSWTIVDSIVTALFLVLIGLALFHLCRKAVTGATA